MAGSSQGKATKGEGFSSSLVYALIRLKCVWNNCTGQAEKISTGGDKFFVLQFDACAMRSQCVPGSLFPLAPPPPESLVSRLIIKIH